MVDAIQKSGGLTPEAMKNIIKRKTSFLDNLIHKFIQIYLHKEGDFDQNLVLLMEMLLPLKNLNTNKKFLTDFGNLSKSNIGVYVVGEVNNPGFVEIN